MDLINSVALYQSAAKNLPDREKDELRVYPINAADDPLYVFVTTDSGSTPVLEYASISSLASGALTNIISYTVPSGKTLQLSKIEVSGDNVALYQVIINSNLKGIRRTSFTKYNENFEFNNFKVGEGLNVIVKVIHSRPELSDFNATLIGSLI